MSQIYHDDEWKREPIATKSKGRTRQQEQAHIDTEFCNGRMTREQWSAKFDELSNLERWRAEGRIK